MLARRINSFHLRSQFNIMSFFSIYLQFIEINRAVSFHLQESDKSSSAFHQVLSLWTIYPLKIPTHVDIKVCSPAEDKNNTLNPPLSKTLQTLLLLLLLLLQQPFAVTVVPVSLAILQDPPPMDATVLFLSL